MYKEKKKLFIFSVLGLITSLVGVSYAFFKASVMGSESNSTIYGVAANLTIEFREGTSQISASDIFPGWSETKTFYIKNNNSAEGEYSLKLFDVENDFMEDSISFEIKSTNDGASIEKRNLPASDELLEPGIVIAGNTTQEYTVKVYYNNLDVDQSADLGKSFTFKIGIGEKVPAPNGWYGAASGTLLAGIKANYKVPTEPLTIPGEAVSSSTEAVMASTPDDYGTSYYFRGNVQNNYVVFANMCWRIVRVTGDGSIKLVLYNYSSTDCTETGDDLAFARYSGDTYKTDYNTEENMMRVSASGSNNKYNIVFLAPGYTSGPMCYEGRCGSFMYGTKSPYSSSATYSEIYENVYKSAILTNLETWYSNNIVQYEDKLADIIWCNEKNEVDVNGLSLICPNDRNGGNLFKLTVADVLNGNGALDKKIGLLTADEVQYAGLKYWVTNINSNYLTENVASSTDWWTLTADDYHGDYGPLVSDVRGDGKIGTRVAAYSVALRPAIALKKTTTISSGTGTATNPFLIN